jgi:hypothetical protein
MVSWKECTNANSDSRLETMVGLDDDWIKIIIVRCSDQRLEGYKFPEMDLYRPNEGLVNCNGRY